MVCSRGKSLGNHINQITASKTATNTVKGIAFGLLLIVSVPTVAVVMLGSATLPPVNAYYSFNYKSDEHR